MLCDRAQGAMRLTEKQAADALGNSCDRDCVVWRVETTLVAALSELVSPLSRPPGTVPDPASTLAAFREVVTRLRKQKPAVAPEVQSPPRRICRRMPAGSACRR
eukprot:9894161-Alexandrium_andersonii.AAC.1